MEFKYRLRNLRDETKISGEELGNILNVGKSTISMWENGKNMPTASMIQKLADYFKVSTDYLLGKSDVRNNDAVDMDSFQVAFYNETKEMSEEMKNQVLDYVRFLRNKGK